MRNGNVTRITPDDVRDLLDSLVSPSVEFDHTSVLLSLSLVDDYISHLDILNLSYPRSYALQNLVTDVISDELRHHRRSFERSFDRHETRGEAIDGLKNDYMLDAIEIMAWSVLYYCYVRVDLNLSLKSMSALLPLTHRTLRRHRQHGVQRLHEVLLDHERVSRLKSRKRRLYAQLPSLQYKQIIGRESAFSRLQQFYDHHQYGTILVSGMSGIGKTAFLRWFIEQQIERNEWIDHVLWIKKPQGTHDIKTAIQQMGNLDEHSFQAFCLEFNVVVVIDDAEGVIEELSTLAHWLKNCFVLMSANHQCVSPHIGLHLTFYELDEDQTKKLINQAYTNASVREDLVSPAYINAIRRVTGGNPTAILLVAQQYALGNFGTSHFNTLDSLVEKIYASVGEQSRMLWVALAMCDLENISLNVIQSVWHISADAVDTLVRCHILMCTSLNLVKYSYASIAGHFAQKRYLDGDTAIRKIVNDLLSHIEQQSSLKNVPLQVVNEILKADWLDDLIFDRQRLWVKQLNRLHEKPSEIWYQILRRTYHNALDPHDMHLNLEYCRMLRQSGQWEDAEKGLQYVLEKTGLQSDFETQILSMIEYSILFKQRGNYGHALKLLQRARHIAQQRDWTHLTHSISLEQAQIAADRLDGQNALNYLASIPPSLRSLMLGAEAHLLLENHKHAYELCYQALEVAGNKRSALANLHTLLGRIDMSTEAYEDAVHHFSTADSYFNATEDLFKQARCWSNLGVALLRVGDVVQARHYLTKAQGIQHALGDALGHKLTTHNLSLIARHY